MAAASGEGEEVPGWVLVREERGGRDDGENSRGPESSFSYVDVPDGFEYTGSSTLVDDVSAEQVFGVADVDLEDEVLTGLVMLEGMIHRLWWVGCGMVRQTTSRMIRLQGYGRMNTLSGEPRPPIGTHQVSKDTFP